MAFAGLNYFAVVLASMASFLFGGLWYGLFSGTWMEAAGLDEEKIKAGAGKPSAAPYLIAFFCQLLMAWALAGVIGHLGTGQVGVRNGLISAGFVWAGFVMTTLITNHTFQMQKRTLTLIDGGHWLGVLLIQGLVIGWMGVR